MKTIGIFKSDCPQGWTRLSAWDGKFLRGYSAYGDTGGSAQHSHVINYASKASSETTANAKPLPGINAPRRYYVPHAHTHVVDVPGGDSSSVDNIPQCIDVVFCYLES